MVHPFIIERETYISFEDEQEQIEQCKDWNLLSEKAAKTKAFFYRANGMNLNCRIIGFVDKMTAVIEFDNEQKHCIHPSYLKEMQAASYGQKPAVAVEEVLELEDSGNEGIQEIASPIENAVEDPRLEDTKLDESKIDETEIDEPIIDKPKPEAAPKGKTKKERTPKVELPVDKVKMTATIKEFTTVPNHFSDNEDEVIIYEAVSMIDPEIALGEAWSSHSATLKKLELEIGDQIHFEGKIVAKKLTKHPVPYKINNPAKIQKASLN
ncbi:hypothetical protein D3C73_474880 [compost metagenome]